MNHLGFLYGYEETPDTKAVCLCQTSTVVEDTSKSLHSSSFLLATAQYVSVQDQACVCFSMLERQNFLYYISLHIVVTEFHLLL